MPYYTSSLSSLINETGWYGMMAIQSLPCHHDPILIKTAAHGINHNHDECLSIHPQDQRLLRRRLLYSKTAPLRLLREGPLSFLLFPVGNESCFRYCLHQPQSTTDSVWALTDTGLLFVSRILTTLEKNVVAILISITRTNN
mmetsp:Transcript_13590/g.15246  ORF Transcript_13590/g.15246 Transcript_13590/m.15246 type:complete len:142 (+) Transcript_13590:3-428(+)